MRALAARLHASLIADRGLPATYHDCDQIVGILRGRNLPVRDVVALAAEREDRVERLTEEQAMILDVTRLLNRVEIRGGAGTGKTSLAQDPDVRAERLRRLSALQRRFVALPIDDAVAVSYGRLASAVVRAGRQPRRGVMDLLIAATAHAHSSRLYTRNPTDFQGLEDLVEIVSV